MDHPEWVRNPSDMNVIRLMFCGVKKFIVKYKVRQGTEDLYSVGYHTCVRVCRKFDESKNIKFSTYLFRALFNNLANYLRIERRFQRVRLMPNMDLVDPNTERRSQEWNPDIDIGRIKPKHREVIEKLFGIGRPKQMAKQISAEMNISRQRIYQIRAKSLNMVAKSLAKQY